MHNFPRMLYLLLLLSLNFSCSEKNSTELESIESNDLGLSPTDTLKFTSGVRGIFQDSKGNYWFGSHSEGVAIFDGNSYRYFSTSEGLTDNQVRSIQEDENGTIWLETANGVSSYDGIKMSKHFPLREIFGNKLIESTWSISANDLWFNAGTQEGVYKYDGQKLEYLSFPLKKTGQLENPYHVTDLSKGKDHMQWIATFGGVFGYNGEAFTIINEDTLRALNETGPLHIRSILEDSKGNLWIGNNSIGVLLKRESVLSNFSKKMNLLSANVSNERVPSPPGTLEHVFVIKEDSKGNIWFGDRDTGAWKYDGKSIENFTINHLGNKPMIWDIYEDKNGNLLFGISTGGVYQFNGSSFEKKF